MTQRNGNTYNIIFRYHGNKETVSPLYQEAYKNMNKLILCTRRVVGAVWYEHARKVFFSHMVPFISTTIFTICVSVILFIEYENVAKTCLLSQGIMTRTTSTTSVSPKTCPMRGLAGEEDLLCRVQCCRPFFLLQWHSH